MFYFWPAGTSVGPMLKGFVMEILSNLKNITGEESPELVVQILNGALAELQRVSDQTYRPIIPGSLRLEHVFYADGVEGVRVVSLVYDGENPPPGL